MAIRDDIRKIAETEQINEKINKINQDIPVVPKSAIEAARGIAYQKGDGTSKSTTTAGGSDVSTPGVIDGSGNSNTVNQGSTGNTQTNNSANNTTQDYNNALTVGGNAGVNGALNGTNALGLGSNNSVISPNSSNTDMGSAVGGGGGTPQSPLQGGDGVVPPGQGGPNANDISARTDTTNDQDAVDNSHDSAGNPQSDEAKQDQKNRISHENGMVFPGLVRVGNLFTDSPFSWNMYISDAAGGTAAGLAGSPVIDGVVGQIADKWIAIMFKELSDQDDVPPGWTDRDTPPVDSTWELGKFWRINITGGLGNHNIYAGNTFSEALATGNGDLLGNLQFKVFPDGFDVMGADGPTRISVATDPSNGDLGKYLYVMDIITGSISQTVSYYEDHPLDTYVYGSFDCPSAGAYGEEAVCGLTIPEAAYTETTYPVSDGFVVQLNGGGMTYPTRNQNIPTILKQINTIISVTDELVPDINIEVGMTNNGGWYITDNETAGIILRPDRSVKEVVPASLIKYHRLSSYMFYK